MGHMQPIDAKRKAKVNVLLRTTGSTLGWTAWKVTAKAGLEEFNDESTWSVGRVAQEVDHLEVAGEVCRMLVQVSSTSSNGKAIVQAARNFFFFFFFCRYSYSIPVLVR
ncbi:hypothetical protein L211DRAFT_52680 [Terfezia boudieri ATCC MYA-4762]|uniref:Uncharacterized protein n=1 Tax=Terfezia boudieri ATCC MYA-4762 TaxID=1051890 RepID=A0A3N4MDL9_9PEZI|nr:hypothetical protein L211DRAFT_52680 [Terfezia boudieri ATCC MYA-4762]